MKKKLVVFSGAGISAESGISTFRDANGLWENHRIEDVASPEGFQSNPQLVLDFYNQRRRLLKKVEPNDAHRILAELESNFDVSIITQNIDDLHERAGSSKVLHLHGELNKVRPIDKNNKLYDWTDDLNLGDTDDRGIQLRPHIVWFTEPVPMMEQAYSIAEQADIFIIIGTSMQVYPAAGVSRCLPSHCITYVIDPKLRNVFTDKKRYFKMTATEGMKKLRDTLLPKAR